MFGHPIDNKECLYSEEEINITSTVLRESGIK